MKLCPDPKRILILLGRGSQSDSQRGGGVKLLGDEILIGVDTPLLYATALEAGYLSPLFLKDIYLESHI